jgi:hypothetical protein
MRKAIKTGAVWSLAHIGKKVVEQSPALANHDSATAV